MRASCYNLYFIDENYKYLVYNTISNRWTFLDANVNVDVLRRIGAVTEFTLEQEFQLCDRLYYREICNKDLELTIFTTRFCNFCCKYCVQGHEQQAMTKLTFDTIEKYIIKNIKHFERVSITLFGGEPTLAVKNYEEFLFKIKSLCKYYHKTFHVKMVSNGYMLKTDMIEGLYKCNVFEYIVTLDGSPDLHDKLRVLKDGSKTFDAIYKNLKNISENKKLHRLRIIIRINTTKETLGRIEDWKYLYEDLLEDSRFCLELSVVENRGGKSEKLEPIIIDYASEEYERIRAIFHQKGDTDWVTVNSYICDYLKDNSIVIDWNGDIRICPKIYENTVIGKMATNGSIILNNVEDTFLYGLKTDDNCRGCEVEPLCQGKRCGFKTACIKAQILSDIRYKLLDGGVRVWEKVSAEKGKRILESVLQKG